MTDGSGVKCILPFKMRERSGIWQEHPSTPFKRVSASCHSPGVNGRPSSLTKEHKVSESPDMCHGGASRTGRMRRRKACGQKNHHLASVSTVSVKDPFNLHLTASYRIRATSLRRGGRWGFCFLISSRSPLTSLCLFSVTISYAHQPPCRPTACQSKLLLTLSSPAQWHRSSPGMAFSKMKNKKRKEMGLAVYTSPLSSVSSAVFMSFLFVFPALIFSLHATTACQGILLTLPKTKRERKKHGGFLFVVLSMSHIFT